MTTDADQIASVCSGCGGAYRFDTSVPSPLWNRVIRQQQLPEYLCTACIVRAFAKAGESFTASLSGDGFHGLLIEVRIDSAQSRATEELQERHIALRVKVMETLSTLQEALDVETR